MTDASPSPSIHQGWADRGMKGGWNQTVTPQTVVLPACRGQLVYPSSDPSYQSFYTCMPEPCQYGCSRFNVSARSA